jgi:spore maturation protein CgeB
MSYCFVKVTSYYEHFLRNYYLKHPGIIQSSFKEQHDHLMNQLFGWSDFFSQNLKNHGVDAYEIVSNAEILQSTWAHENNCNLAGLDLLKFQLKSLKPDVIFFQDSIRFNSNWVMELKKSIPSLRLIIGWCCSPYTKENLNQFRNYDFMMVCSPRFFNDFKKAGIKVYQMMHAFESSILNSINGSHHEINDISFIGSIMAGKDGHIERLHLLNELLKSSIKVDLYTRIEEIGYLELKVRQSGYIASKIIQFLGLQNQAKIIPKIQKFYALNHIPQKLKNLDQIKTLAKNPVYGLEMYKVLSESKIGFNAHGSFAGGFAANIRLFEVTGVGSCLLTDYFPNMNDIFEDGKECVTYKSTEECIEKVNWLLSHPNELKQISIAGQKRTLKDHTFARRAEELHGIISKELRK